MGSAETKSEWETWPTSTPSKVRPYRKELHNKVAALPYAAILEDSSDSEDEPSDGEPLELEQLAMSIYLLLNSL